MKRKIFTSVILCAFMSLGVAHSQLLMEENFDYDENRPLVMDAVAASDNYDGVTGWSTQSNSLSGDNRFNMTEAPLTYDGYISSGIGNALKYANDAGQGVFKLFSQNVGNDSAVYVSFLINIPADEEITGGDYFLGIKMEPSAASTNWGGRIFASVLPSEEGEEISFSINKMSGGTLTSVPNEGPFFAANTTHLLVMKYHVGVLNGNSAAEEEGNYDDVMSLYINPPLTGIEPAEPLLVHQDPSQRDLYRYAGSGAVMGGARGLYLRASTQGNAPAYTIDGIRVGLKWEDVIPVPSAIRNATADDFTYSIQNKKITVATSSLNYDRYELVSLSGQVVKQGSLVNSQNIDASSLQSGIYILMLNGSQQASAKIIIR